MPLDKYQNIKFYTLLATGPRNPKGLKNKNAAREKEFIKWNKIATKSHGGTLEDMLPLMVASMRYEGADYLIKNQNKVLAGSDLGEREKFYQARLDKVSNWLGTKAHKRPWLDLRHIPTNIHHVPPNEQDKQFQKLLSTGFKWSSLPVQGSHYEDLDRALSTVAALETRRKADREGAGNDGKGKVL